MGATNELRKRGDTRAASLQAALAADTRFDDYDRVNAARSLAELGDTRAADLLYGLAANTAMLDRHRVRAARALASLGDPRAANEDRLLRPPSSRFHRLVKRIRTALDFHIEI
ncbi:hypothetical protein [Streptomyces sp. KR55]|uniref:hypothetical protein n=1 Tax=Streptomyces sp. KR55 TaxID=3457425 RepID=UPI003FD1CC66